MKRNHRGSGIIFLLPVIIFSFPSGKSLHQKEKGFLKANYSNSDTVWKVNPIAKLKEPAPGGGSFEEFGDHYYLESGAFVFWARFDNNQRKDWALYTYKNGTTKFVLKAFEKYTEPDGKAKEFLCIMGPLLSVGQSRVNYGGASNKVLYLIDGLGALGQFDNIYSWNGDQMKKVIGKDDKINLPGDREIIIKAVRLESINNDQALIFFVGDDPKKTKGWLLHDGNILKPLFIVDDELGGLPGIKLKGIIVNGMNHDKFYIFNDTILANLFVDGASYRQGIYRISKNKAELIESSKGFNPTVLLYAEGPDNFIYKYKEIYHYKNGNRKFILENIRELPKKDQFLDYNIFAYGIAGPGKESIVFAVAGDTTRLFLYHDNKLSLLTADTKSLPFDLSMSPLLTRSLINHVEWARLKTDGPERFDFLDIIGKPHKNKIIVKHTPIHGVAGFYELTK